MKQIPILLLCAALAFAACKDKPDGPNLNYDRSALAANVADNLVLPAYDTLLLRLDSLEQQAGAFNQSPDSIHLLQVRQGLRNAWESWSRSSAFEFGPGADRALRQTVNTFPADVNQINQNILAGTYDLNAAVNIDARGFPALDYLLNGSAGSTSDIVTAFGTAPDAGARRAYLSALSADLIGNLSAARNAWTTYAAGFKALTGTDAGSATSMFLNQLNYDLEVLKNGRIGIPLGKTTLGQPVPANVEVRYGGYSAALAKIQLRALRELYLGQSVSGVDGYGLLEALDAIEAQYNGAALSIAIRDQFDLAVNALDAVPDPLDQTVVNAPATVDAAYVQIQRLIVLTKTDMASNLGILITYNDNDGD